MRFDKITVEPSDLQIPNVFTPDGDGLNDYFVVESKSLRNIRVEVYSRSGLKVYNFYGEGEALRNWKGWDGNINNSSAKAPLEYISTSSMPMDGMISIMIPENKEDLFICTVNLK